MRPWYEILIDYILRTDNLRMLFSSKPAYPREHLLDAQRGRKGHLFFVDALHYLVLLSLAFLLDFVCTAYIELHCY
jgi:hypothetical protein